MREPYPIATTGAPLESARVGIVLLHGRGAAMVHKAPERVAHGERIGPNPAK